MNAHTKIEAARALGPDVEWEGRPAWRSAAIRIWKVRLVALYFVLLLAEGARVAVASGHELGGRPLRRLGAGGSTAAATWGRSCSLAWLTMRTTRYSLEEGCVVMRYGIALAARLEIPFAAIEHVGVRIHPDHTGDIALRLKPGQQVAYLKLWPHARPWRWFRPEPMLRCVPAAGAVGAMLSRNISAANLLRASLERAQTQG